MTFFERSVNKVKPLFVKLFANNISVHIYSFRDNIVESFRKPTKLKISKVKNFLVLSSLP